MEIESNKLCNECGFVREYTMLLEGERICYGCLEKGLIVFKSFLDNGIGENSEEVIMISVKGRIG